MPSTCAHYEKLFETPKYGDVNIHLHTQYITVMHDSDIGIDSGITLFWSGIGIRLRISNCVGIEIGIKEF